MNNESSYVYIIARHGNEFGHPIKIGVTSNIDSRLSMVRTYTPFAVDLFDEVVCTPTRAIAFQLEARLHKHFKQRRLNGEWFDVSPLAAGVQLFQDYCHLMIEHGVSDEELNYDDNNLWTKHDRYERLINEHQGRMGTYVI